MGADGEDLFKSAKSVLIKQEWAAIEACSCEAKNRYRVSVPQGGGTEEGEVFLYVDEDSGCLERICCSVNRSLTLRVHEGNSKDGTIKQSMYKPFHIQGCCCCRPWRAKRSAWHRKGSV